MACPMFTWETGDPIYPSFYNFFNNGYIKLIDENNNSVRLSVEVLNSIASCQRQPKMDTVNRWCYEKAWLLSRVAQLRHSGRLLYTHYQRMMFAFGWPAAPNELEFRLPDLQTPPAADEMRETEGAPFAAHPTTLSLPPELPHVPDMSFFTYQEIVPFVQFHDNMDHSCRRGLSGRENPQAENGRGWLPLSPNFNELVGEDSILPGPTVRKKEWLIGYDQEQVVIGNRDEDLLFWVHRVELVENHKLHFLKKNVATPNPYHYRI